MLKLVVALLATFMAHAAAMVAAMTAPILAPHLHELYGVEGRYIGLYSSIIYFGSLIAAVISVQFIKSIGALSTIKVALVLALLGTAALLIRTPISLFLSAFIIGLAFGPMNPTSSVVLANVCPPNQRGRVFSIKQGAVPFGAGVAALVIPFLYAGLGLGAVVAAVIAGCLVGLAMVMATGGIVDTGIEKPARKWSLVSFLRGFRHTFSSRELRCIAFVSTGMASVQFTFASTLVYVLVAYGGFDPAFAGALLSLVMVVSFVLRPVFGAFADRFGSRIVIVCNAAALVGFSLAFPFLILGAFQSVVIAVTIAYGASCFSWNGVALSMLASLAPPNLIGEATAGTMAISLIGASLAPVVFTALLAATNSPIPAYMSMAGFATFALIFAAVIKK